ncbi:MAG TPA: peptidylprolyl isomerase [Terriglobia bacterium]|nr:peptidylprolyl isomerase [Terriglobia bacterium]
MKKFLVGILATVIASGALHAQTPASKPATAAKKKVAATKRATRTTKKAAPARPSLMNPASLTQKAPEVYRAKFTTTKGIFVVEVTRAWAPLGADRFYNLVKYGYFTDASFFRVLPKFMVQFGINAKPALNTVWQPATIQDDPVKQSNKRGMISFATGGPNTRTTQVFINFADNTFLDNQGFAPFGQVVQGMDVVDKFDSEYGEGAPQGSGPEQGLIQNEGKPYLDKNFPKLDSIKTALILRVAPVHKPAVHHTAHPTTSVHKTAPAKKKPA